MIVAAVNAKDRFYIEKDILSGPYMTTCDPFLRSIGTVYNTIVANYLWPIYFLRYLKLFLVATKWFIDNRYNKQVFWCSCGNSNTVPTLTKSFTNTFVYHYGYLFLPKKIWRVLHLIVRHILRQSCLTRIFTLNQPSRQLLPQS